MLAEGQTRVLPLFIGEVGADGKLTEVSVSASPAVIRCI